METIFYLWFKARNVRGCWVIPCTDAGADPEGVDGGGGGGAHTGGGGGTVILGLFVKRIFLEV